MNNYGKAALRAVELIQTNQASSTREAWDEATIEIFGQTSTRHRKACPRSTFLGLCEEGLVKGISQNHVLSQLRNQTNKEHAVFAIEILANDASLSTHPRELWKHLMKGDPKSHNFQMDVVTALWNQDLIVKKTVLV